LIRLAISVGGLFTYWTRFGSKPKSLNVASRELADQQVDANAIPVMALSISERELLGADIFPVGHLAARNYFQSINSAENEAFIKMWVDFNEQRDKTTNDSMEATRRRGYRRSCRAQRRAAFLA
jgi:hypothetical protein